MARISTPPTETDVVLWLVTLSPGDLAFIFGCALQRLAMCGGMTEAALLQDFARRADADPDCQVVRPL